MKYLQQLIRLLLKRGTLNGPEHNKFKTNFKELTSVLGSFLVLFAGILLNADVVIFKYFPFELEYTFGWGNTQTLVWTLLQSIAPIILITSIFLRPYYFTFAVPLYFYVLQIHFTLDGGSLDSNDWFNFVVIGVVVLVLITSYLIMRRLKVERIFKETEIELLKHKIQILEQKLKKNPYQNRRTISENL